MILLRAYNEHSPLYTRTCISQFVQVVVLQFYGGHMQSVCVNREQSQNWSAWMDFALSYSWSSYRFGFWGPTDDETWRV